MNTAPPLTRASYYERHRDERKAYGRAYYERNREIVLAKMKAQREYARAVREVLEEAQQPTISTPSTLSPVG